jgi:hypothetical protein
VLVDLGDMQLENVAFFLLEERGMGTHFLLDFGVWNVI